MDKDVVHIGNGVLFGYKKRNKILETWMDLESVIYSEVVREKQILYINTYV